MSSSEWAQDGAGSAYLEQFVFPIVGAEALRVDAFQRAWQAVISRHRALRASFDHTSAMGEHRQLIHSVVEAPWTFADYRADGDGAPEAAGAEGILQSLPTLGTFLQRDRVQGMDLSRPPLLRFHLGTMFGGGGPLNGARGRQLQHVFVLTIHHILFDGWSLRVLLDDVAAEYAADLEDARHPTCMRQEMTPEMGYHAFVEWELQQKHEHSRAYFTQLLKAGCPIAICDLVDANPSLPCGSPTNETSGPARAVHHDGCYSFFELVLARAHLRVQCTCYGPCNTHCSHRAMM